MSDGPNDAAEGKVRLSKVMAARGLCSRREADEWISRGWVRVDGVVVDELGTRIDPSQDIKVTRAAQVEQGQRATVILHKPTGYVSGQAEDGHRPAVLLVTGENQWSGDASGIRYDPRKMRGLAPAGRLDIDSTGLLILTQDGRVARQLIGAESDVDKEYLVRVAGRLDARGLALLNHGLSLDDRALRPAQVTWQNKDQLRFILREGRKRQIRRMCELVGVEVVGLKRVRIGAIMLGALPAGQWRYMQAGERFDKPAA